MLLNRWQKVQLIFRTLHSRLQKVQQIRLQRSKRCRQPLMILMKVYRRQQNSWKIHIKKQRDMLIQQKTAEKAWKLLWGQWLVSVRLLRRLAISFQRLKVLQARLTFFHLMLPLRLQEQVMQAEDLQ